MSSFHDNHPSAAVSWSRPCRYAAICVIDRLMIWQQAANVMKNRFKCMAALRLLSLAGWLCLPALALGRSIPPFDLDTSAGNSEIVAHGELHPDGTLRVIEVFKGKPKGPGDLRLPIEEIPFKSVSKDLGNEDNPQVVVFLTDLGADGVYRLALGYTGSVVAFGPSDKVFAWMPSEMSPSGAAFQAHPSWTKRTFMEELKQSLKLDAELDAVLAKPRDGERLATCYEFLRAHQPWKTPKDSQYSPWPWAGHGYFFSKIARATQKPSATEESVLAELLRDAGSETDRARVLGFVGSIHSSRALYPEVLPWVDVKVPMMPRQQAFRALASIDSFAADEVLSHFLSLDDPLIDDVLETLGSNEWMQTEPPLLNPAVLDPLLAFGRQVFIKCHSGDNRDTNRGYLMLLVLQGYFHPILLPLMIEWANDKEVTTSAQAMSHFGRALGFLNEPANPERIAKWWAQNSDVVISHYDLSSWAGTNAWLQAWRQSDDKITKHVLLRLWDFTPSIPEQELLNACEGEADDSAKELLSELWQRKRLTTATRKALVAKWMKVRIVDQPCVNAVDPKVWRTRYVVGDRLFPFPHDAWVNWTGEMTTEREPKILPDSFNSQSLEGSGPFRFAGGTVKLGSPFKAILEIWEKDYQVSPPKELWRLHWELDQDSMNPVGPIPAE